MDLNGCSGGKRQVPDSTVLEAAVTRIHENHIRSKGSINDNIYVVKGILRSINKNRSVREP